MRRRAILIPLVILLAGCSASSASSTASATPTPTDDTETATPDMDTTAAPALSTDSLSPDTVTDYDRTAVTALINTDLTNYYGQKVVTALTDDAITFAKKDGQITATGTYYYKQNYKTYSLPFTYIYDDQNIQYELVSKDIGTGDTAVATTAPSASTSNMEPAQSYNVTLSSSISVTLSSSGEGSMIVQLKDSSGNVVKQLINQTNPISTTETASVEAGDYVLEIYSTGGSWSISYSTN